MLCSSELFNHKSCISGTVHSIFNTSVNLAYNSDKIITLLNENRFLLPYGIIFSSRIFDQLIKNIDIGEQFNLDSGVLNVGHKFSVKMSEFNVNVRTNSRIFDFILIRKSIDELFVNYSNTYKNYFKIESVQELFSEMEKLFYNGSLIKYLIGRGPGLTPSGDDIICGFIYYFRNCIDKNENIEIISFLNEDKIIPHLNKTCIFSGNMIKYAIENCYNEFFDKISIYSVSSNYNELKKIIETKHGSYSGFDSVAGLCFAEYLNRKIRKNEIK
ncbi:DUF2877 domain-containing protein [Candidatus Dependentiae bacterium]|nr:DUF2877 domain-containing protein [Candidatus Dependentiae bacterium]